MSSYGTVHPPADAWVAAIHASDGDFDPIGTAVVIDADRLLTCAHVLMSADGTVRQPLWVSFPKADEYPRRLVASVIPAYSPPVKDLAVLVLQEPVPVGVEAAPLRCPKPPDLVSNSWWAFGFPDRDPIGDSASGVVGAALALGWVRLDTQSRYLVRPGFSGGGLWSPDYKAVVGVVGQAHGNGDGRAITLHQADLCFPDQKLAMLAAWSAQAAGEIALQQWGWTLAHDPEGVRHWRPRARGVSIESERGYRFSGRTAALTKIVQWLDRPDPDRRVLVVTGSPGVGKSAVLGRIVTTADPGIRASLPPGDGAVRASVRSVSCAVHAKAKTALEVAEEIARAASARLPEETNDLAPAVRDVLGEPAGRRFNVIIDALDEASSPAEARAIIEMVVLPLAETCADVGAQVVVGTRRRDDGGDLLGRFGNALAPLDLDVPQYFAEEDLVAYALACLQLTGDERPGNPYSDAGLAAPLASRIAAMSGQNFLVAGLIARSRGLHDEEAADPEQLEFSATVDSALAAYLQRLSPVSGVSAERVFTALAFAEAPGLPIELWRLAMEALDGTQTSTEDLTRFVRSSAANFLIEVGGQAGTAGHHSVPTTVYRLFHQALNDALLRARSDVMSRHDDEQALTLAFSRYGRASNWEDAPDYLLRSLPGHADASGTVDDLLCDDAYLLHADLRRLMQVADKAASAQGRRRAQLLRLTPRAINSGARDRAALFSVTEALDNLGTGYRVGVWQTSYQALWASVPPHRERAVLEGHRGGILAVCPVTVAGRELLASGGDDGIVRVWDPQTGELSAVLEGHRGGVRAVCPVTVAGRQLLASGGDDGMVRVWDPQTGEQRAVLEGEPGWVLAVCRVSVAGRQLLASGGHDGTVRVWDPQTGEQRAVLERDRTWVLAVCPVTVAGRQLVASGGQYGTVRVWDPQTGDQNVLEDDQGGALGGVLAVCPVTVAGRQLVASGGDDGMVRVWDPQTGEQSAVLEGHRGAVRAVCPVTVAGRQLVASGGDDGMVRVWDPQTGDQSVLEDDQGGALGGVRAVCPVTVAGRQLVAGGGGDGMVRVWDPQTGELSAVLEGHRFGVLAVCPVTVAGRQLVASGGRDGLVRVWDPQTNELSAILGRHRGGVLAVCPVTVAGRQLLASGGHDEMVRVWDPQTRKRSAVLKGHQGGVLAVCPVTVAGRQLLASGGHDGTVRVWDPQTREQSAVVKGHQGGVLAVCPVTVAGRQLLASGSDDRTVRIWDPHTAAPLLTVPTHYAALAVVQVGESLAIGLSAGILVIKPNVAS